MKDPQNFVYVADEDLNKIGNVDVKQKKKPGILKFLSQAYKDNKEYKKYKKEHAKQEKKFYKALENIKLTPEQLKNAKQLQKNTFMTFNKVDENSQKFSESIEALGLTLNQPLV